MKTRVIILAGAAIGALLCAGIVHAQRAAAFAYPERIERIMDATPEAARAAIEAVCTQEQLDAIEDVLYPDEARLADKLDRLETVVELLGDDDESTEGVERDIERVRRELETIREAEEEERERERERDNGPLVLETPDGRNR